MLHTLLSIVIAYHLSGAGGVMMPDGKVDPFIQRPVLGASFGVEFQPTGKWHCLQQWNNASVGVGLTYYNLGNEAKLGSAFALYGYMNQPFYNALTLKQIQLSRVPTLCIVLKKVYQKTIKNGRIQVDSRG